MSGHLVIEYRIRWANLSTGAWETMPGALKISPRLEAGSSQNGLGWGDVVEVSAQIEADFQTIASTWYQRRVNAQLNINSAGWENYFTGILARRASSDGVTLTYEAVGFTELIKRALVQTDLRVRIPVATETTATSVEDPEATAYAGGLANELFWKSGGRPYEQAASYPTALWYYSCHGSAVCPAFGWTDGDNAYDQMIELAKSAGGQIYQTADGVVRYVSPLRLSEALGGEPTYSESVYTTLEMSETTEGFFNVASATFVRRQNQVSQAIKDDRKARRVEGSTYLDVPMTFDWPILSYDQITVKASDLSGAFVTLTAAFTTTSAQRATVRITNSASAPALISRIIIYGQPVTKDQEDSATFTGTAFQADGADVAIRLDDSTVIQTYDDALRRCRMAVRWYDPPRAFYVARGCPFQSGLVVGQYAELTSSRYGLTAEPCRVVSIDVDPATFAQDVGLAPVNGIPVLSDFFVVDTVYSDSDTRQVGF